QGGLGTRGGAPRRRLRTAVGGLRGRDPGRRGGLGAALLRGVRPRRGRGAQHLRHPHVAWIGSITFGRDTLTPRGPHACCGGAAPAERDRTSPAHVEAARTT